MPPSATNITAPFIPMVETEGQKVFLPLWIQGGNLLQFDPETQWAKKQVKPQNVTLDQYISAAVNPEDKLVYIKALNGNLAKMDPKSKEAELVTTGLDAHDLRKQNESIRTELPPMFRQLHLLPFAAFP